jgi:hypothetical protein
MRKTGREAFFTPKSKAFRTSFEELIEADKDHRCRIPCLHGADLGISQRIQSKYGNDRPGKAQTTPPW